MSKKAEQQASKKELKAVGKYVVVKPLNIEAEKTKTGIYLPRTQKKILGYGIVLSVGNSDFLKESGLKKGDKIIYQEFERDKFTDEEGNVLEIVREDQILCSYED